MPPRGKGGGPPGPGFGGGGRGGPGWGGGGRGRGWGGPGPRGPGWGGPPPPGPGWGPPGPYGPPPPRGPLFALICAYLIPPLGIFWHFRGRPEMCYHFLISVILTALGYIPGVLYACCVIGCDQPPPAPVAAVEQL